MPTAGPAHPTPSPPAEGGGVLLCPRALAVATVATAALGRGGGWGSGTPRLPLGLPEKAFSPRTPYFVHVAQNKMTEEKSW